MGIERHESVDQGRAAAGGVATMRRAWPGRTRGPTTRGGAGTREQLRREIAGAECTSGSARGVVKAVIVDDRRGGAMVPRRTRSRPRSAAGEGHTASAAVNQKTSNKATLKTRAS